MATQQQQPLHINIEYVLVKMNQPGELTGEIINLPVNPVRTPVENDESERVATENDESERVATENPAEMEL